MKGIIVMGIMVMLAISIAGAEEIYKWTDENGTVHYSNVPPPTKKAEDMDTVQEKTGVSKIGDGATPQTQSQQRATQQSPPPSSQQQGIYWIDSYGNRHLITQELIAQEKALLEQKIKQYEKDRASASSTGKNWYDDVIQRTKDDLKVLQTSPQVYFATKEERASEKPQRQVEWAEDRARQAEQQAEEAEREAREAEQRARDAEAGIP